MNAVSRGQRLKM